MCCFSGAVLGRQGGNKGDQTHRREEHKEVTSKCWARCIWVQRGLGLAGLGHSASLPLLSTCCVQGMLWQGPGAQGDVALSDRYTLGITTTPPPRCLVQRALCLWPVFPLFADALKGHLSPFLAFPAFLCSFVLWIIPSFPTLPITEFFFISLLLDGVLHRPGWP